MKRLIGILCSSAALLISCSSVEGPQGPIGPTGPAGSENVRFYDTTGVLPNSVFWDDSSFKYWTITLPYAIRDDSCLVQTWVRLDDGYLWKPPTWYYAEYGSVRIIDDEDCDPGHLFKINVVYFY